MQGTIGWERPYFIKINGQTIWLQQAINYELAQELNQPFVIHDNEAALQFSDGVLRVVLGGR
jgi:transposase-like protein